MNAFEIVHLVSDLIEQITKANKRELYVIKMFLIKRGIQMFSLTMPTVWVFDRKK